MTALTWQEPPAQPALGAPAPQVQGGHAWSPDPQCSRHVVVLPAQEGVRADWPAWLDPRVQEAYVRRGIPRPWVHQVQAAEHAWAGRHVGLMTGTASGKSAAFGMPGLTAVLSPAPDGRSRGPCVLYLSPTKALAQDQHNSLVSLGLPGLRVATYDGDTPHEHRAWARAHARWLITNPDMVHRGLLPDQERWRGFLRCLRLVVIDESHVYRGVFGAHVALVIRRLLRVARRHGSAPTVIATSATTGQPGRRLAELIGDPVTIVDRDTSERASTRVVFWQPGELDPPGGPRRGAIAEAARLAADLIGAGHQTLVFARSRRGAEAVASAVRDHGVPPERIAAYRGGYLPEERRELESRLRTGSLAGLAATNALELGIDISGLDAVVMAGWPGSRASFLQQSGRAGRRGRPATAVLVAREDPLDQYLVSHPEAVLGPPVEAGSFRVANPYVLAPHLAAAAAEAPLLDEELPAVFGSSAPGVCASLAARGLLRRRRDGWYWTSAQRPSELTDLRGAGGPVIRIVEESTGRMLGTCDRSSAPAQIHAGAVYTHQGLTHVITELDLANAVAQAVVARVDYDTQAREVRTTTLGQEQVGQDWPGFHLRFGEVEVTSQVVAYRKRRWPSGEVLGEFPLDLPVATLPTTGTWWTIDAEVLADAGVGQDELPGTLHAAEHAAIGLLPLVATCDRWDIGGVSMVTHPQTCQPTIVVYDGAVGGAGFAEAGFHRSREWLAATLATISGCPCASGCPSCIQSPKCGNGNSPLDKSGAIRLLARVLRQG